MTIADINEEPRACATDGKSHLNLTRSLADVWGLPAPEVSTAQTAAPQPRPVLRFRFAGYDPTEVQVKKITQAQMSAVS